MKRSCLFLWLAFMILYSCKAVGESNALSVSGDSQRYRLMPEWPQLPKGYLLGNPSGIGIDNEGNIVVFHRASKKWPVLFPFSSAVIPENTVILLHRITGEIKGEWRSGLFVMPYSPTVDKDDNIWVTDVGLHQVLKFDHNGKLLMTLGVAGVPGADDSLHFNCPTDVAVAPDGSFYVSDGYRNSRVVKFSPSGKYLLSWGTKGSGDGQFDIPHGLDVDGSGNIYMADRENNRIQIFDPNGKFIGAWRDKRFGKLYTIRFDKKTAPYLFRLLH